MCCYLCCGSIVWDLGGKLVYHCLFFLLHVMWTYSVTLYHLLYPNLLTTHDNLFLSFYFSIYRTDKYKVRSDVQGLVLLHISVLFCGIPGFSAHSLQRYSFLKWWCHFRNLFWNYGFYSIFQNNLFKSSQAKNGSLVH